MAIFATFGYISSFGVYQDLYVLAGTASSSNVSWIGSTQLWFFVAMGLPAGGLLDKGYFKHLILVGTIIYVFRLVPPTLSDCKLFKQIAVFSCFLWHMSTAIIKFFCLKAWGWE